MANVKISDGTEDTAPGLNDWIETETAAGSSKKVKRRIFNAPLGYAYSNTATGAISLTADVSGMSVTFSLPDTTVVEISFAMLMARTSNSGRARIKIDVDGSTLSMGNANANYYSQPQAENNVHSCAGTAMASLGSGSHTIKLIAENALATATTDFWARTLIVRAMG